MPSFQATQWPDLFSISLNVVSSDRNIQVWICRVCVISLPPVCKVVLYVHLLDSSHSGRALNHLQLLLLHTLMGVGGQTMQAASQDYVALACTQKQQSQVESLCMLSSSRFYWDNPRKQAWGTFPPTSIRRLLSRFRGSPPGLASSCILMIGNAIDLRVPCCQIGVCA